VKLAVVGLRITRDFGAEGHVPANPSRRHQADELGGGVDQPIMLSLIGTLEKGADRVQKHRRKAGVRVSDQVETSTDKATLHMAVVR